MSGVPSSVVSLRDLTDADLPILFEHQLDPEATAMAAFPSRGRVAFVAHWVKILADATIFARTVLVDGRVAGDVVSWMQGEERLVGYWIGREFWGRGVASRALAQFVGEVADRPLYAYVAKHNPASIRVLEKCGFAVVREQTTDVAELVMRLDSRAQQSASASA